MRNKRRYNNMLGFVDVIMNLMMCFIILFALTLMMLKVDEKKATSSLQVKGKLIIHLHWPDQDNTDLDLWVRSDNPENIVSFRQLDSSNMWLDHDSRGANSNKVTLSNGTTKSTFGNDEVVQFKECTNTKVTVNVHVYRPEDGEFPMSPVVEIIAPDSFVKLATRTLTLSGEKGQEVTAFSFNLDEDCKITKLDQDTFVPFVYNVLGSSTTYTSPGEH